MLSLQFIKTPNVSPEVMVVRIDGKYDCLLEDIMNL